MRILRAAAVAILVFGMTVTAYAVPCIRMLGGPGALNNGDIRFGNTYYTPDNCANRRVYGINLSVIPFATDNSVYGENLYPLAAGTTGFAYKNAGTWSVDNAATFVQRFSGCVDNTDVLSGDGTCIAAGSGGLGDVGGPSSSVDGEIALFDNTTGKKIKRATTTGVLKGTSGVLSAATAGTDYLAPTGSAANLTNFPQLNQNTTGTAAGLTAAYINWSAGSGGSSILNKPTIGTLSAKAAGTMTNAKFCTYSTSGDTVSCNSDGTATMTYPGNGIAVALDNAWTTSKAAPAGAIVGTTDAQELSNKSFGTGMSWPTFNQNTTGTAAALTANGGNCSAGNSPLGVDAAGAVESCFDVLTQTEGDEKVTGPASATDNALMQFDGTGGKTAKNSPCVVGVDNVLTCPGGFGSEPSATQAGSVLMRELSGNGADNVTLRAPDSITTSYQVILPAAPCADNQIWVFNGDNTVSCEAQAGGPGGGATWGSITGTLSNQTDLQDALDAITAGAIQVVSSDPFEPDPGTGWINTTDNVFRVSSASGVYSTAMSFSAWDTAPTAFAFNDNTGLLTNTLYESNTITVAGINYHAPISISGNDGQYRINAGSWVSSSGNVSLNDNVTLRQTTSGSPSTELTTTLNIGGVTDIWSVTTAAGGAGAFGDQNIEAVQRTFGNGTMWIFRHQCTTSGELDEAFLYSDYAGTINARLYLYESSGSTPAASDDLLATSNEISSGGSTGWKSATWPAGTNVSSGTYYWIGVMSGSTTWDGREGTTAGAYYNGGYTYPTGPPNLTDFNTSGSYGPKSMYVTTK